MNDARDNSMPAMRFRLLGRNLFRRAGRSAGFTFVEVLFAVVLLGIGFIMIAGIFPVAIQQSTQTTNDTTGALVCRDAIKKIQQIALTPSSSTNLFPTTNGVVVPLFADFPNSTVGNARREAIGFDCYYSGDLRYAWHAFYRRDSATSPFIRLYIIAVENDAFPKYYSTNQSFPIIPPEVASGATAPQTNYPSAPFPAPIFVQPDSATGTFYDAVGNPTVTLTGNGGGFPVVTNAVTGAYLLISDAGTDSTGQPSAYNGRVFRLGTDVSSSAATVAFQLLPGMDLNAGASETLPLVTPYAKAYLIGRAPDLSGNYTGPLQDVAAMSTEIRLSNSTN